jgi:hypothetical protein
MVESPMKAFDIMKEIQVGAQLVSRNSTFVDQDARNPSFEPYCALTYYVRQSKYETH